MDRDDEFGRLAAEYAAAEADVIEAERHANQAARKAEQARTTRDGLRKKMAGFVGANARTRNALVGGKLVRVEWCVKPHKYDGAKEHVDVSVEDVTVSREAAP